MPIQIQSLEKVTLIVLSGRLKTEVAQELKDELYSYCDSNPGHTLIDMSEVTYVSSYLIGVLVGCHKKLKASGSELHLVGLNPTFRTVLEVSGLTDVFPRHETREEGIAHFH
jgi:anti-anti-sigma factor